MPWGDGMFMSDDPTLARSASIGTLTHCGIGRLAPVTRVPSSAEIRATARDLTKGLPRIEARAHTQKVIAGVSSYFWHLLPDPTWMFYGSEVHLGTGRVDLLWRDFVGRVLIDEVKTGHPRTLLALDTHRQVENYRRLGLTLWGPVFAGIRLLSTSVPSRSVFIAPDGLRIPLQVSSLRAGA